jgi:hypothetical protein
MASAIIHRLSNGRVGAMVSVEKLKKLGVHHELQEADEAR